MKKEFFQGASGCIAICSALMIWYWYHSSFIRIHASCMFLLWAGAWLLGKGILNEERFVSFEARLEEWRVIIIVAYLLVVLLIGKIDMPFFPYFEKQP